MDYSHIAAFALAKSLTEGRSAMPDAPVVAPSAGSRRLLALRGRIASMLHRAAWAIEPRVRD